MSPPAARLSLLASSVASTHAIAGELAAVCRPGDIVVLAGEMGAGKTAFAQGFGHALGVTEPITSPTFTLVHSYDATVLGTPITLHHADIYRLEQFAEVADLALGELAEFKGIVLVEWGDVVAGSLGEHLVVRLDFPGDEDAAGDDEDDTVADVEPPTGRCITISATGTSWARRWPSVTSRLAALGLPSC
ncbi:tRNA (adenosine(37)-N6)-threonylcarbamoyltransferase complex ATPase subunit type 1 TsaE [Desertimonas flava]|uniref:tRNA (adenosine(37)-N6)-threonylcarbamoyltransferase complex ATPase subunit type 1 TsaE n=1 Tax=Desertimonas flava TaxID=2064846 RepID=UPI000E352D71|nr:tRNA (adenosine(37)-N6)-threonylcarbamoyltransferase complex ATPase subunit type 1 TsaE [Desertimonas flava]